MAKKTVTLTAEEANLLEVVVCEGPMWGTPKEQWRQMRFVERLTAWREDGGPLELETISADRKALVQALEHPQVVGMLRGRATQQLWAIKEKLGWQPPDVADLEDDDEDDE